MTDLLQAWHVELAKRAIVVTEFTWHDGLRVPQTVTWRTEDNIEFIMRADATAPPSLTHVALQTAARPLWRHVLMSRHVPAGSHQTDDEWLNIPVYAVYLIDHATKLWVTPPSCR